MLVDISRHMNVAVWWAQRTGRDLTTGDPTYGPAKKIYVAYASQSFRRRMFQGDESPNETELLTTANVVMGDRIWPPGKDHTDSQQAEIPDHVYPEHDPKTGRVVYKVVRL